MRHDRTKARKLLDIGSTTALSAMVEIVEGKQDRALLEIRNGKRTSPGILARQALAMLERLEPSDQDAAIEAFCDELQSFVESVPGIRSPAPERGARKRA